MKPIVLKPVVLKPMVLKIVVFTTMVLKTIVLKTIVLKHLLHDLSFFTDVEATPCARRRGSTKLARICHHTGHAMAISHDLNVKLMGRFQSGVCGFLSSHFASSHFKLSPVGGRSIAVQSLVIKFTLLKNPPPNPRLSEILNRRYPKTDAR
ncbi:hypothetical protein [Vibrio furnissii]|uniref:hypothetical protein n=1 Tax=Vibrio furnissii TaxID=29494 RepID=UPI001EEC0E70|nr:hypothetical protein [Vibrio furnissii]